MSSVVLDTQRTSTTGPVTSVSFLRGAVSKATPSWGRAPASTVDVHDAEAIAVAGIDEDRRQGNVGAGIQVLGQHQLVVHLVDVIAGEYQHILRLFAADGVDVLVDSVGRAQIPVFADALHRRQDLDELAQLAGYHRTPAFADVAVERESLVLSKNVDMPQVGVQTVGERHVDDPVVAAEGDRGFGTIPRERIQALAGAPCEQDS